MRKSYLCLGAGLMCLAATAHAQSPQYVPHPWVLVGLDMGQGVVTARDTAGNGTGPDDMARLPLLEAVSIPRPSAKPRCAASSVDSRD
jgi:hypothetical protein